MKRFRSLIPFLLIAIASLPACAAGSAEEVQTGEESRITSSDIGSSVDALAALGNFGMVVFDEPVAAPDFTALNPDGTEVSLSDFRGKVVLLNFWATWCAPCRIEMPSMQDLYTDLKEEDFVILAVNVQEELPLVVDFLDEYGYDFPVVLDSSGQVSLQYGIRAFPTTYVIGPDGMVIAGKPGIHIYDGDLHRTIFRQLMTIES